MKCHYEVLCISRDASASEIKKAYRKLALQWHPDKNLENSQEAKEQFQLVQTAYEVLYDPQERAWYDNHREQLLKGAGSSYNDDSLDVYPYFSPSCYKGFGDDAQGFYGVYAEIFSKLASEETDFLDDPEEVAKIPKFGNSTTPYEDVHEFYAYWMAFSTNKSYVWLNQYEISQGDNRRVIKLMEKENNKIRQKARKERNEEIRRLVSYVRRRDKRVIEHTKLLQEKAEENKRKTEQIRRDRIIQRQKEIEEAKLKEGESSFLKSEEYQKKLSEIESLLAEEFGLSSDDNTISEGGMESSNEDSSKTEEASETSRATKSSSKGRAALKNLYCSACNKIFKNINSFENHENSKKHKDKVTTMMLEDEIEIYDQEQTDRHEENDENQENIGNFNGEADRESEQVGNSTSDIDVRETLSDDSDKVQALPKSHKKKKNKKKSFVPMPESEGNDSHDEMSFNEIEGPARSRKAKKFNMLKSQLQAKKEANLKKGSQSQTSTENLYEVSSTTPTDDALGEAALPSPRDRPTLPKVQRNIKPKKLVERKTMRPKASETEDSSSAVNLRCVVCQTDFPSKNKLFEHLKKTGHSVPIPQTSCAQRKSKRSNR